MAERVELASVPQTVAATAKELGLSEFTDIDMLKWRARLCSRADISAETISIPEMVEKRMNVQEVLLSEYLARSTPPKLHEMLRLPKCANVLRVISASPELTLWIADPAQLFFSDVHDKMSFFLEVLASQFGTFVKTSITPAHILQQIAPAEPISCWTCGGLTMLDLSNCSASTASVSALCQEFPGLEWLNLRDNNISELSRVADDLKTNRTLKFIGLARNTFSDLVGVTKFVEMLATNHTLTKWHLSSSRVDQESLVAAFQQLPGLAYFCGSWIRSHQATPTTLIDLQQHRETKPVASLAAIDSKSETPVILLGTGHNLDRILAEIMLSPEYSCSRLLQADHARRLFLECVQLLTKAVPHYGSNFECSAELSSLCAAIQEQKVLDENCAAMIFNLCRHPDVQRTLEAAKSHILPFPASSDLFSSARRMAKDDYVPAAKELAFLSCFEGSTSFKFKLQNLRFHFIYGGREWPQQLHEIENCLIVIAANPGEITRQNIAVPRGGKIVTYSAVRWTEDSFLHDGFSQVRQASSLQWVCKHII